MEVLLGLRVHHVAARGPDHQAAALVGVRIRLFQARAESDRVRRRPAPGFARPEARSGIQLVVAAVGVLRGGEGIGRPQLGGHGEIEARRHDAGDQEILVVQADILADNGRVGGKPAPPQPVAQHHFALAPGLVFALLKAAAQHRLDTEGGEEVGAHQRLNGALRLAAGADDVGHAAIPRGDIFQRRTLAADIVDIGHGDAVPLVGRFRNALQHHHQAFQMRQARWASTTGSRTR